ncbi:hypothetical protein V6N13_114808 [Hibiscus sabdariffa]
MTLPAQTHILRTESSCTRSSGSQCNNELGSSKVPNDAYTTLSNRTGMLEENNDNGMTDKLSKVQNDLTKLNMKNKEA